VFKFTAFQTASVLPNPEFSNTEALTASLTSRRAIDGEHYTYVKTKNGRRKLQWTFLLTRNKALELRAFIIAYYASVITVIDHEDRKWVGHFTNHPFGIRSETKAGPAIQSWPRGETHSLAIEFEGVEV